MSINRFSYVYEYMKDGTVIARTELPSVELFERADKVVRQTHSTTIDVTVLKDEQKPHVYALSSSRGQGWSIHAAYDTEQSAKDAATKMTDAPFVDWVVDMDGSLTGTDGLYDYEFKIKRVPMEAR